MLSCRVDAGKVELDGAQYLGFRIPLTISQLVWIEAVLVGGAEVYRNRERDPETRLYPGKPAALPTHVMDEVSSCLSGMLHTCLLRAPEGARTKFLVFVSGCIVFIRAHSPPPPWY